MAAFTGSTVAYTPSDGRRSIDMGGGWRLCWPADSKLR
jgi:hypothetical protein